MTCLRQRRRHSTKCFSSLSSHKLLWCVQGRGARRSQPHLRQYCSDKELQQMFVSTGDHVFQNHPKGEQRRSERPSVWSCHKEIDATAVLGIEGSGRATILTLGNACEPLPSSYVRILFPSNSAHLCYISTCLAWGISRRSPSQYKLVGEYNCIRRWRRVKRSVGM